MIELSITRMIYECIIPFLAMTNSASFCDLGSRLLIAKRAQAKGAWWSKPMNLSNRRRRLIRRMAAVAAGSIGNPRMQKKWQMHFPLALCLSGTSEDSEAATSGKDRLAAIRF
jgi:hypothetical protein